MNTRFWKAVQDAPDLALVAASWRKRLGERFAEFQTAFLQRTSELAPSYPCPLSCGCAHRVVHHSPTDLVAVCECVPWNCDDIPVTPTDVMLWELSWSKLGRALCRALTLEPRLIDLHLPKTRQIGSWSAAAVPVILAFESDSCRFRHLIAELGTRLQAPFILLAPTSENLTAANLGLLAHAKAGFFDLESYVSFAETGTLHPAKSPGDLFARFTPAPTAEPDEDTARKAMAIVSQLDVGPAPSPVTVFRLYCIEQMSIAQIARKCSCSTGTVANRLRLIHSRTGAKPLDLRRFSPHLAKVEEAISDPRASHIHRESVIYDEGPDQE